MKRCFAILLALMIVLSLAACGGKDDDKPAAASPPAGSSKPSGSAAAPNLPPALMEQLEQDKEQPDESKPADSQPSGEEKEPLVKNVGENIWIGSFEGLDIQWRTLAIDEENEKALLITEDVIGHWVFSSAVSEDVTWETSDIREWLNGTFYNGAFSEEQKAYILESEIVNSANPATGTESGADTVDRVFLLSYEEAQTYFPTGESMRANYNFPQEYMAYLAKMIAATPNLEMTEQEALDELNRYSTEEDYASMWWLRTSGNSLQTAAGVEFEWVSESLNQVWTLQGIRPAIWVNLSNEQTAAPAGEDPVIQKANALAVKFGSYNGSPIKWRVLDVDTAGERALLITEECIDEVQFHAEAPEDLTYRVSDLRVWLIGDFHYSSFTAEEKERIIEVTNPQDTNSETGAREPEGYETTDTVFILSATEMQKYFADDEDMAGAMGGESFSYWTRTPGNDTTGYVCTYIDGGLYMTGNQADSTGIAVRPAIWVDLSGELAVPGGESGEAADSGSSAPQVSDSWPDNEFTRLVPVPELELTVTGGDGSYFMASFANATIDQIKDYAEQVKAAGFDEDPEIIDTVVMEKEMFSYSASNGNGYIATVNFSGGASAVNIKKE